MVAPPPGERWLPGTEFVVAALVAATFCTSFGALHYGFYTRNVLMDTPLYERYGDAIVHGSQVPYRDFAVEYPPAALPVFALPSLVAPGGDFGRYREAFEALMLACGAAAAALVGAVLARRRASTFRLAAGILLTGLAPLALGPVVVSRFDLWPALLTVAALASLVSGRRRLGCAALGFAIAAKIYPGVALPLALTWVWQRYGRREALVCTGIAGTVVAACYLPFAAVAPHGVWASLSGQAQRPLQIESLGAAFLLGAHQAFAVPLDLVSSHGSDNLAGRTPHVLALASSLVAVVALVAIWISFARGKPDADRLLRYAAAAVCAFIVFSKVISPQYLIWLMPLVPLVRGRRGALTAGLFVGAMVLTQLWFPQRYLGLAYAFDARSSWLVLARDLALVALLVTLVWPSGRARRLGAMTVATVMALATAATVAAATGLAARSARSHVGLLAETGRPSSCTGRRVTPSVASGTVRYATSTFTNRTSDVRCVTVTLHTGDRLFSAAYAGNFDPVDATKGYLGSTGICANLPGVTGAAVHYAFRVPASTRFTIEVEQCGTDGSKPGAHTLDIRSTRLH